MSTMFDSRAFSGGEAGFSLQYPLFALKRLKDKYLGIPMGDSWPYPDAVGIPLFTSPATVVRYLTHTKLRVRIKEFDRIAMFRMFLRPLRDVGTAILFDLHPDRNGMMHSAHVFSAATLLDRFLPEPSWGWSYPIFVLRFRDIEGWACLDASGKEGRAGSWLVVFTDEDLADQAVANAPAGQPLVATPVESKKAFAAIVRSLKKQMGAIFDPPDRARGGVAKFVMPRQSLLANLDMEL